MKPAYDLEFIRRFDNVNASPAGIRPEAVAAKLRAAKHLENPEVTRQLMANPRLTELLWFIQAMAHEPGGLKEFARAFLLEFPERIGSEEMRAIGWPASGRYTMAQCKEVFYGTKNVPDYADCTDEEFAGMLLQEGDETEDEWGLPAARALTKRGKDPIARALAQYTPRHFWEDAAASALTLLPGHLSSLCNDPAATFLGIGNDSRPTHLQWDRKCFQGLTEALLQMMDRHAGNVARSLAQTEVSRLVFDELFYAWSQKVAVFIAGDSRYGKSKAVSTWCRMWPGKVRLVTVPDAPTEWEFMAAHADALGLAYSDKMSVRALKQGVEFIIKHSGFLIAYDEAHFLVPAAVTKKTVPRRMNWVRCQVVDRDRGAAFFTTRQSYGQSLSQFVAATQYQFEQWVGRMERPLIIPAEVKQDDVLAVARHKFPNIPARLIKELAGEALVTDTPLHTLEHLAKRAMSLAQMAGREVPFEADVNRAVEIWNGRPDQKDFENAHARPKAPKSRARVLAPAAVETNACRPSALALPRPGKPVAPTRQTRVADSIISEPGEAETTDSRRFDPAEVLAG